MPLIFHATLITLPVDIAAAIAFHYYFAA